MYGETRDAKIKNHLKFNKVREKISLDNNDDDDSDNLIKYTASKTRNEF